MRTERSGETEGGSRAGEMLAGKRIAFTGRLASMTRGEAAELVRACGGEFTTMPARSTDFLVIGEEGWPLRRDGRLTRKLEKARALQQQGAAITILAETDFLRRAGLEERREDIHRLCTTLQLSRILGVPRDRIRLWVRCGLIQPARTVHRLDYFEFHQVAAAKTLAGLAASGVPLTRVRRSLDQLRAWLPAVEKPLAQLRFLEHEGRMVLRLPSGGLAEPDGQLLFDFSLPAAGTAGQLAGRGGPVVDVFRGVPRSAGEWFELALDREDTGRLEEAAEAYEQAIAAGGPQPEFCFNLGNVLYALGRKEEAAAGFLRALESDPQYVECWNNLGNVLGELRRWDESVAAYRRALEIEPGYADAHYNLAETLNQLGCWEEACVHWRAYLRQDPNSSWARVVRERLERAGGQG